MEQTSKELLIKDLTARLPYEVKVKISCIESPLTVLSINTNGVAWVKGDKGYPFDIDWEYCKPYIFPLSSMTEEQKEEHKDLLDNQYSFDANGNIFTLQDFYCKYHLDFRGLIPMGLAIDATNLNIY